MFKVASLLLGLSIFTRSQIQVSIDVGTLLDTATDCLRFTTEFFEVINQSAPHIYHSALQLAPRSSMVRKLYGQEIYSPMLRVVTGILSSWDPCVASAGTASEVLHATWSPCGRLVAVGLESGIEIRDSITFQMVSNIMHSDDMGRTKCTIQSLAFSPDGSMLACYSQG